MILSPIFRKRHYSEGLKFIVAEFIIRLPAVNYYCFPYFKSSRPEVFCKIGAPKNFAELTGKHLCRSLFVNKVVVQKRYFFWSLKKTIYNISAHRVKVLLKQLVVSKVRGQHLVCWLEINSLHIFIDFTCSHIFFYL